MLLLLADSLCDFATQTVDYLAMIKKHPKLCRTAFQRIYYLIMHYGSYEYVEHKKKLIHYKFFDDPKKISMAHAQG